ncbi:hypothetical protein H072_3441 [Dactylellina haptotyla CBS 200.50]|uniref:Single-stranded DNA-binding protein n=1 Tax=Dactylellina haptotyla (strain CBS 200.50) TaxID=1284197 RepID=S8ANE7_DACHA|nr:hypothetical protein H072_3441 [Dactylellina haptotyla CBS 200.50]
MSVLRNIARGLPRHPTTARLFSTSIARADISRVQIIGRIGTEPEISQTSNGNSMIRYAVASSIGYGENISTQWHRVVAFGDPNPERLIKGAKIFLEGDLRLNTYDGEDGKKHTSVTIKQRSLQVLSKPANASSEAEATPSE